MKISLRQIDFKYFYRKGDICNDYRTVAYIPEVEELAEVQLKHSDELLDTKLDISLPLLCLTLKHESEQVRKVSLQRIKFLCSQFHSDLLELHEQYTEDNRHITQSILCTVVQSLLQLCSRETSPRILSLCGFILIAIILI